ncbi:hypothetical protein EV368DRAFT_18598, partial [Lentinula lateritia]
KMLEGIFVGYEDNRIGWRVRDTKGKDHFSDQVVFNESQFGRLNSPRSATSSKEINHSTPVQLTTTLSTPVEHSNPPKGPRPRRTVKLTERGKEWQDGIRKRD